MCAPTSRVSQRGVEGAGTVQMMMDSLRARKIKLDIFLASWERYLQLRHPTFQRIFGGLIEFGSWTFAGTPLYAISRSNWSP